MTSAVEIEIRQAGPLDEGPWDAYVHRQVETPPLAVYGLAKAIAESCHATVRMTVAVDADETIKGVLSLYVVKPFRGAPAVYSPNYGLIADDQMTAKALVDEAGEWAVGNGYSCKTISLGYHDYELQNSLIEKETLLFPVGQSDEEDWRKLRDKTRNSIRKARKFDLEITTGLDQTDDFYAAYSERLSINGVPFLPKGFFEIATKKYGKNADYFIARDHGRPVAGMFVIFGARTALYFAGGAKKEAEKMCVTHLLMWNAIEACRQRGVTHLDMGESRPGSGVYRFKKMFGGVPRKLYVLEMSSQEIVEEVALYSVDKQFVQPTRQLSLFGKIEDFLLTKSPMPIRQRMLVAKKCMSRLL